MGKIFSKEQGNQIGISVTKARQTNSTDQDATCDVSTEHIGRVHKQQKVQIPHALPFYVIVAQSVERSGIYSLEWSQVQVLSIDL